MKSLIHYFIDRPLIVNLLTLMILIVGGLSIWGLQREIFPKVEFDVIVINTSYPGSSAEDVEKLVTVGLERKLKSVEGIKEINAMSTEGRSIIYIEVEADSKLSVVLDDVKNAVDSTDDLPEDATTPVVRSLSNKMRGAIKVAIFGDASFQELRESSKALRDRLERVPGVSLVELGGNRVDEIRIEVHPDKLNLYELTMADVYRAVEQRNLNLSAGKFETPRGDVQVRILGEFENLDDVKNVVVNSNTTGKQVKIADIAYVERVPEEGSVLVRSQGKRAIFVEVNTKEKADIITTTMAIKSETEAFFKELKNPQISFRYTDDGSYYVKRRLDVLKDNGLLGMILVFLCLMLFLNFSTSVVTSLGAPVAFMISFICMDYMGISINLVSMFALILVLGMLVDDSIIVAEHFYQKVEQGMAPKEAAREAAWETIRPVTATVLTTIVAFGSLFFMGGIMGKFLWAVPAVVIICLAASLFECFFILPSHLADFTVAKNGEKKSRWYDILLKSYGRFLRYALRHPYIIIVSIVLVFIGSLFMATKMRFELFPGDDARIVFLQLKGKVGTPLQKTDEAMKKLEALALEEIRPEELDQIRSNVGQFKGSHASRTGGHYASLMAYLTPPDERERGTDEILQAIAEKAKGLVPDFELTSEKVAGGPPKGRPLDIQLMGDDLESLRQASHDIRNLLLKEEGVMTPEIDYEEGKKQIVVRVNDREARRLGLTTKAIAWDLRRAMSGDAISDIRETDEDIPVRIFLDDTARKTTSSLQKLYLTNAQGHRIALSRVASFKEAPGAFIIRRLNGKRVISIGANLNKEIANPVKMAKVLRPKVVKVLSNYPGINYEFGGENKDTQESMSRLKKSAIISLLCIFFILVVMFSSVVQPLIVMMAIPFGFIGVILAFKIFNQALGFMAFMGVIGLVGVVVNDSIVLVNFINEKRKEVDDIIQAIYEASISRLRPVLLTTFTTVAGLMPMAHSKGGDPFLKPMAMSFSWGLLLATFVTLIFIPCNYLIYARCSDWLKNITFRFRRKESLGVVGNE